MKDELTTTKADTLIRDDGQPAYTPVAQLHPDYNPEQAQRTCAKQWGGLFGTLTFIAVIFPVLFRELPPPDVLMVGLLGVAIMATIGYQMGYIWGSPIIRTFDYTAPVVVEEPAPVEEANPNQQPDALPEKAVAQVKMESDILPTAVVDDEEPSFAEETL